MPSIEDLERRLAEYDAQLEATNREAIQAKREAAQESVDEGPLQAGRRRSGLHEGRGNAPRRAGGRWLTGAPRC
jgi:hypothetical protein